MLGAIPKQPRQLSHRQSLREDQERRCRIVSTLTKQESNRRSFRRRIPTRDSDLEQPEHSRMKENRPICNIIQPVEGLECLVHPRNGSQRRRSLSRAHSKSVTRTRRKHSQTTEASSSSSNNELSSLLPPPPSTTPLLAAFLDSRPPLGTISCRKHSPPRIAQPKRNVPITLRSFLNSRIAASHNDTSEGSRHFFRDEHGNLWTYRFSKNSSGVGVQFPPESNRVRTWINFFLRQQRIQNQLPDWNESIENANNSFLSLNSSG